MFWEVVWRLNTLFKLNIYVRLCLSSYDMSMFSIIKMIMICDPWFSVYVFLKCRRYLSSWSLPYEKYLNRLKVHFSLTSYKSVKCILVQHWQNILMKTRLRSYEKYEGGSQVRWRKHLLILVVCKVSCIYKPYYCC